MYVRKTLVEPQFIFHHCHWAEKERSQLIFLSPIDNGYLNKSQWKQSLNALLPLHSVRNQINRRLDVTRRHTIKQLLAFFRVLVKKKRQIGTIGCSGVCSWTRLQSI